MYAGSVLFNTGASHGNYVGQSILDRFDGLVYEPVSHWVVLGDGTSRVHLTQAVTLDIALYDDDSNLIAPISTQLYVMPDLVDQIIIGLPEILGNYYDFFISILERARERQPAVRVQRLYQLYRECRDELCRPEPRQKLLKSFSNQARVIGSWYSRHKQRIQKDRTHTTTFQTNPDGTSLSVIHSATYGSALDDDTIETLCEMVQMFKDFPIGEIIDAWSKPIDDCPEETETPDPLAFDDDVLHYMKTSHDDARREYLELLETQVTPEMRDKVPRAMDILTTPQAFDTFSPTAWNGLKVPPISFNIIGDMPASMQLELSCTK